MNNGKKISKKVYHRAVFGGICLSASLALAACGAEEESQNPVLPAAVEEIVRDKEPGGDVGKAQDEAAGEEAGKAKDEDAKAEAGDEKGEEVKSEAGDRNEVIEGSISTVDADGFSIAKAMVDGNVMVSTPDDEIIQVVYTENTEFELCHSSDGGITCQYTKGSGTDLEAGQTAKLEGQYFDGGFKAAKITLYFFGQ